MNVRTLIVLALAGCATGTSGQSAEEQIVLYAVSGEEARVAADSTEARVSASFDAPPPIGRECDPHGVFHDTFDGFDADRDGALGPDEEKVVEDELGGSREDRDPRESMWHLLTLVYDTDGSGDLEEAERDVLLDDFAVRCEAMTALLLAEFDADGDGALSEEELAAARESLPEPPEGGPSHDGPPPEGGPMGGGPMGGDCGDAPPPLVEEFDADGSGDLSEAEMTALRDALRAKIRSGEPLLPPPPPAE